MNMTHSMQTLQRELDRCKSEIFLRRGEGHLAQLLCSIPVIWAEDAVTAYTNGMIIAINPNFFMKIPAASRETVLASKLWNIAMMHLVRGQGKRWDMWNMAATYWVNNLLRNKGYKFDGLVPWFDHRYDDQVIEQIYEDFLIREAAGTLDDPQALWGYLDEHGQFDFIDLRHPTEAHTRGPGYEIPPTDPNLAQKILNAVVQSTQYAAQADGGYGGAAPMADLVNQFLQPKVKWEKEVVPFLTAANSKDYSWSIPNPRIRHTYLPSLQAMLKGGLANIRWYGDSSGSMTKAQLVRWNSEARYVHKKFKPKKFTLINFDDEIQMIQEFKPTDRYDEIKVLGRGGTDLNCVRNDIIKTKPDAVIIFSDLGCDEMLPLPRESMVPILWIVLNNPNATVPHGRVVHISE